MTINDAVEFLEKNYDTIQVIYKAHFGDIMSFANPRVEQVLSDSAVLVSCHYDGYDDYDDTCDDPDCSGDCEICDEKYSWSFTLSVNGLLPGGVSVA